jgi:hypothetical protein
VLLIGIGKGVDWAADQTVPVTGDIELQSAFIQSLNATEAANPPAFQRAAVQSFPSKRFMPARLVGDALCSPLSPSCNGVRAVFYTSAAYKGLVGCATAFTLFGHPKTAAYCAKAVAWINATDRMWNEYTAGGEGSDGIVQSSSQLYPGVPMSRQFTASGDLAPSHVGETRYALTYRQIKFALEQGFDFPRATRP